MNNDTIHGWARLDLVGILLNGQFVFKEELGSVFIGADDLVTPLYSNQMNTRKAIAKIKLQSLQNYVEKGGKQ